MPRGFEPGTDEEQSSLANSPNTYDEMMERPVERGRKRRSADCGLERSQSVPVLPFQRDDDKGGSEALLRANVGRCSLSQDGHSRKVSRREYPVYGINNTYRPRAGSLASSGGESTTTSTTNSRNDESGRLGKRGLSDDSLMDSFADSITVSTPSKYKKFKARDTRPYQDSPVNEIDDSPARPDSVEKQKEEQPKDDVDYGQVNTFLRDIHLRREALKRQTPPPVTARVDVPPSSGTGSSSSKPRGLLRYQNRYHQEYLDRQRAAEDQDDMAVDL